MPGEARREGPAEVRAGILRRNQELLDAFTARRRGGGAAADGGAAANPFGDAFAGFAKAVPASPERMARAQQSFRHRTF